MILIILFIIFVLFLLLIMTFSHAPIFKISKDRIVQIKKYGLLHFTSKENAKTIIETNKLIGTKSNMNFLEKRLGKMIWFYDNMPKQLECKHNCLIKKYKAQNQKGAYDVCLLVTNLNDDHLKKFHTRKGLINDSPSVYFGDELNNVKITILKRW